MHTNIDKSHLNLYVGREILGFDFKKTADFIVEAEINMNLSKFQKLVKKRLNLKSLKIVKSSNYVKKVSLTTGAGVSLLPNIKTDCFLTGDIKYHEAMEGKAKGITLLDIGHYESEIHFITLLENLLENYLKNNDKKAIIMVSTNPFKYK